MTAYTAEQAAQIDWHRRWRRYGLPTRFWDLGVADMQPTPDNTLALGMAADIVASWPKRRPQAGDPLPEDRSLLGKGGIVIGPYSTGKTRLMCGIATDIARTYNTEFLYMPVAKYFSLGKEISQATDVAVKLRDDEHVEIVRKLTRIRRRVITVPLLVWDDQGKEYESGSGWVGAENYRILRERFDRHRPTLITTNVPLPEWSDKYEGSMFSFLHEAFDAAAIGGMDWRRAGR